MTDRIRIEEPGYVARYREASRHARTQPARDAEADAEVDHATPSFVRNYRRRAAGGNPQPAAEPNGASLRRAGAASAIHTPGTTELAADVYLVRHGEAIGDDHDADLTDQGAQQARTYGTVLARQCRDGDRIVLCHADTRRSAHTADHIAQAVADELERLDRAVTIIGPAAEPAFANVRFVGPTGPCDITAGFRSVDRDRWVSATADRPLWLIELDRFWQLQLAGGDPIELWLTTPMLHFEPPSMVVRRLWAGIDAKAREHPGARLVVATHTGCIRALAVAALGYDPGDLYNLEDVRAKLFAGRRDALVSHRNRVQEVCVPNIAELPVWKTVEDWRPATSQEATS